MIEQLTVEQLAAETNAKRWIGKIDEETCRVGESNAYLSEIRLEASALVAATEATRQRINRQEHDQRIEKWVAKNGEHTQILHDRLLIALVTRIRETDIGVTLNLMNPDSGVFLKFRVYPPVENIYEKYAEVIFYSGGGIELGFVSSDGSRSGVNAYITATPPMSPEIEKLFQDNPDVLHEPPNTHTIDGVVDILWNNLANPEIYLDDRDV